ncbi:MAG: histidine phosphatase family protein [Nocardioidaceae bacterium]|nr:histidine phosphatase family protein [Nocardioidaceae bacterium]
MEQEVWLVRHGETEWSKSGQHTSTTDLPLTPIGEEAARSLRGLFAGTSFDLVMASPRQRARVTAELAGITDFEIDPDLVEWDYGDYEGLTRVEVHKSRPDWSMWTHGAPNGESPEGVTARVDRVISRLRAADGRVLLFGHGHLTRALAARWLGQPVSLGVHLRLDTGKLGVLGYDRGTPTLDRWNSAT